MNDFLLDSAWCRALTLRERVELFRAGRLPVSLLPAALERAEARLRAWRAQAPFRDGDRWRERLEADACDEATLRAVLAADAGDLGRALAAPPDWLLELESAYPSRETPEVLGGGAIPYPDWVARDATGRFLPLFAPLVQRARERLQSALAELRLPASCHEIERMLVAGLPMGLTTMVERTAVLELHVARHGGRLEGDTPEARFDHFVGLLGHPSFARQLLREYPVLGRAAAEFIQSWLDSSLELMRRLAADQEELRATLLGVDPGALVTLQLEAGDAHRGGRSVAILGFESGVRLVYKPRAIGMEAGFQELLVWLGQCGADPPFRTLHVLDRGEYGWVEFAAEAPCAGAAAVERYFERVGGLLAVLHAVGAMDFHFQNLVASGEHPVAIDLESLFHPTLPSAPLGRPDERLAAAALGESVLRVGMLPFRVNEPDGQGRHDWSGLASVAGQISPDPVLDWERPGTDEMRAVKRRLPMKGGRNRPTHEGRDAEAADHIAPLAAGFERTYRLLLHHRDELLRPDGPLARLASHPGRVVLRTTRGYALLLDESWHPDFLRDALDRDRFFDRLWVGAEEMPAWRRAAAHDHRALWRNDIPWYGATPTSRDLLTAQDEVLPEFVAESGFAWCRRRLLAMGEDDLLRQSWITKSSLGTLILESDRGDWPEFSLEVPREVRSEQRERLLVEAKRLGDWFERTAFRDEQALLWIALDLRENVWSLFPCSEDLYSGAPGIAQFLAALGAMTGEERYLELARQGMETLLGKLRATPDAVAFLGLYQGWGGAIYALAHLGTWTGEERWWGAAEELVPRILDRLESDQLLDVVGGAAGAIAALLALDRARDSRAAREAAIRCGEHLVRAARPAEGTSFWLTQLAGDEAPTGFAHGASGIASALLGLAAAAGEERFLHAGLTGLAFERPALREELSLGRLEARDAAHARTAPALALTWCYGAPGMGLARVHALRALEATARGADHHAALQQDLEEAVTLTLERGFGKNHCLCHGDLGNLDFLLQASEFVPSRGLPAAIGDLTEAVLASLARDGWRCGTLAGIEAPGLMNGLAGIGYGLLRLAAPDLVPSVLGMDPPRTAPRRAGALTGSPA